MNTSLHVLALVTDAFGGRGGIAQYNRDFIEALVSSSDITSVDVLPRVSPDTPGSLPEGVRQFAATQGRLAYAAKALATVGSKRYDLIYNGHLYLSPLAACLCAITRARMISQLHGTEIWEPLNWLRRQGLQRSQTVLCVSRDTRARTLAAIDIDPERLVVLPNTVHSSYNLGNREAARRRFGLGSGRTLLTVARLDAREGYKGHDCVIDALPILLARDPDLIYLIAGEGDDRARLERRTSELGLRSAVRFLGYLPFADLPDVYRASDVFVMPSTGEGFGIVYLEAMACGTPAVGLAMGGAADALGDGELGHIATKSNLADTIWAALARPVDRQTLSAAVAERFGPTVHYCQLHTILHAWERRR